MTDTPERICIGQFRGLAKSLQGVAMDTDDECDATICRDASSAMMEAATALEAAQARIAELEAERSPDFERLRQRGFAPGSYWCFCSQCGKRHNADKRAFRCLECAEASADQDARAEALEEAAAKADDWTLTAEEVANGTGWPANVGEHIGDAIRALKGGSNG